jgi:tetratricopeptide (TPR) repeat protein
MNAKTGHAMAKGFRRAGVGLFLAAVMGIGVFPAATGAHAASASYIEWEYAPRFYPGDEDARIARAHFIRGEYGLAAVRYRRAVEATHQNGAAWVGLAASYDRIGRYDLAARAYRVALRLGGANYIVLNNLGYEQLLRGDRRQALRLLTRAQRLAPADPTIANNIAVAKEGHAYFWNGEK